MTEVENLVLELRAIRKEIAELKDGQAAAREQVAALATAIAVIVEVAAKVAVSSRGAGKTR